MRLRLRSAKCLAIVMITVSIMFSSFLALPVNSASYNLYPIADSYVDSTNQNKNYGSLDTLHVYLSTGTVMRAYIKFNLTSIPSGQVISSAILKLYCCYADPSSPIEVDVHATTDSWSESTIKWNNAPSVGALVANNTAVGGTGQYWSWNITDYVYAQYIGDKIASVVVKFPNDCVFHRDFRSKEKSGTSYDPYLEIIAVQQRSLSVSSAHDSPVPGNGLHYYDDGSSVTCSVTSPVTEGNYVWTCTGWSGTGSVPATGTGKTVTFTITSDSTITWNWQSALVQRKLTVYSAHDGPDPGVGDHYYDHGSSVTCSVTSPVTEDNMVWTCTGWSGTGSVPATGSDKTVTFTITADSTITWNWQGTPVQRKLTVSSGHDSPVPSVGDHYYNHGDSVTCSVSSPVTEGDTVWTCTGWSGTGSVPATGSDKTVTFTITQDSSIIWSWQGTLVQRKLTVYSGHDTPVPSVGDHYYDHGSSVTCSVTSPVTEDNMVWTCTGWSGTGSVPATGSDKTVTFTITQDSSIIWSWQGTLVQRKLTVYSGHDTPVPSVGDHYYDHGSSVTCSVTSPVTEDNMVWTCTGWSGTGSVPATGSDKTVTFTITSDSGITWNWEGVLVQCKLTVSSGHDTPVPSVGDHYYDHGSSVTCSVTSPVTEDNMVWTCTGWSGTGSVPATGTGKTVTFTITSDSTITWNWQSALVQRKLTVYSGHDTPVPSVGDHYYDHGSSVTCSVTSPVTEDNMVWTCTGWSGTGSVPATGSDKTVTFTITSDSGITWNWEGVLVQCKLTVSSGHDTPVPSVGDHYYDHGSSVTCSVTSPVTEGDTVWTCTGWSGTGSVPATGTGKTVTFTITGSTITWNWQSALVQRKLTVYSGHDSPVPSVGDHYYNHGDSVTCSVSSPVTEGDTVWTCSGWSGTGDVPASGGGTSATFTITQDSTITWNWLGTPVQRTLTVSSAHDTPVPVNGPHTYNHGDSVTCSVTSPVTEGNTVWTCTGWTGTGSVPLSGSGASVTFTITQVSTITWNWHGATVQGKLTVHSAPSSHDTPAPSAGDHYYNHGDSVTCSVTSPVTEGTTVWTCTGWTGSGSVPSSGSGATVTFTVTQDSTITWNWQGTPIPQHPVGGYSISLTKQAPTSHVAAYTMLVTFFGLVLMVIRRKRK